MNNSTLQAGPPDASLVRAGGASGHRQAQGGPPLPIVAAVSTALLLAGYLSSAIAAHAPGLSLSSSGAALDHYLTHSAAIRAAAALTFASAIPLAIYAATVSARLRNLGIRAPGASIALTGGTLASGLLAVASCSQWLLSVGTIAPTNVLPRAFVDLYLLLAGPGRLVCLGLLLAGIAVPAAFTNMLPRPIVATGLVLAAVDEILFLNVVFESLSVVCVAAGLASMAWLVIAGLQLPLTRGAPSRPERSSGLPA
jgi:hypothetical protein